VSSLSRGDCFDEISQSSGQARGVSARASEDLEVMLIVADSAQVLMDRNPCLALELGEPIKTRTRLIAAAWLASERAS
jgi:CRP-like cAMP-binding protein